MFKIFFFIKLFDIIQKEYRKEEFCMASVKWTREQLQAINEKGNNILVAAAARKWKNSSAS